MTDTLEWTVHLARRNPRKTAALVMVALGALAAWWGFRSIVAGILSLVLLLGSVSDYLFPVRYRLSEEGIAAAGPLFRRRMKWGEVRRVVRDELGVKLSPLPRPSRLEAYRGIYLWFAGNGDEVMEEVERRRVEESRSRGVEEASRRRGSSTSLRSASGQTRGERGRGGSDGVAE